MNIQVSKSKRIISYMIIYLIVMQLFLANAIQVYAVGSGTAESDRIIVSMGDSYSSGEGLGDYFSHGQSSEEKRNNLDWIAHRSEHAWSGQLTLNAGNDTITMADSHYSESNKNGHWYFVAASGAETTHINQAQEKKVVLNGNKTKEYLPAQIDVFDTLERNGKKADYITLTLGGNDLGFADIAKDVYCAVAYLDYKSFKIHLATAYMMLEDDATVKNMTSAVGVSTMKSLKTSLKEAYINICRSAGPQASLIVAGYPKLFDGTVPFTSYLFAKEIGMVNNAVKDFNKVIEDTVSYCRDKENLNIYYVKVEGKYKNHGAYSINPFIHGIYINDLGFINGALNPEGGNDDINNDIISAKSMHPNEKGAAAYAEAIQEKINSLGGESLVDKGDGSDLTDQSNSTNSSNSSNNSSSQAAGTEYQDFIQDKIDSALAIGDNYIQVGEEDYYCKYSIADFDGDGANELAIYSENWWGGGFQEASTGGASIMFYKYNQGSGVVEEIGGFGGLDAFWDNLDGECPFVFHKNGYITIGDYVSGVKYDWVDSIALLPMQDMNGNTISDSSQLWKWGSVGVNIDVNAENPVSAYYTEGMGVSTYYPVNGDEFVNNINNILSSETISPTFYNFGN